MYPLIPFNKPYFSGNETRYIEQAVRSGKIFGDGLFMQRVHKFFEQQLGFARVLLTTSCTYALEMAALLLNIQPGDEVMTSSFTFVSAANTFVLRGANVVFVDSTTFNPNLAADILEGLVTLRTRAMPVHYAGIACNTDVVLAVAQRHRLAVVEGAAHSIDSFHRGQALGSLGTFSFYEIRNIVSGEGGMLAVNDAQFGGRTEIVREKGTNRTAFYRGEVAKYNWVDVGSSFLPSDIIAAYLWAQLENLTGIQRQRQRQRQEIWQRYYAAFEPLRQLDIGLPVLPNYATNYGHLFYLVCRILYERTVLIAQLRQLAILAIFRYQPLHQSLYYVARHDSRSLP